MADGLFQILWEHEAKIFASAIPRSIKRPESGLIVMDEVEKVEDRRFLKRMEDYFTKTATGPLRTAYIKKRQCHRNHLINEVVSKPSLHMQTAPIYMHCQTDSRPFSYRLRLTTIRPCAIIIALIQPRIQIPEPLAR
ncbi:MAG: hypothetical protein WC360_05050 [Opitutales bacterium]|jgi:hypothetical protein